MMKTYWKTKWLKALRSGKYKQGKNSLKTARGNYCCLGVLCDVVAKTPTGKKHKLAWDGLFFGNGRSRSNGVLPCVVERLVDLGSNSGMIFDEHGDEDESLSSLNDKGRSFKQIADIIEEKF